MQANDIVMVTVTGTNGDTRHTKTIAERFNGAGKALNDDGMVNTSTDKVLRNLPNGTTKKAPDFPTEKFLAAQNKGADGVAELDELLIAHAKQVDEWKKSIGGGDEKLQLVRSVIEYTKEFYGFQEQDGNHFVIKPENLQVTSQTLSDGRTLYTVSGTAIFG